MKIEILSPLFEGSVVIQGNRYEKNGPFSNIHDTVRPRDTLPQAARTLTMHVFENGPKKFEMQEFM